MLGKKKGKGRKKIELKKIKNNTNRQITFVKRCVGLINKANELCIHTGAHVDIFIKAQKNCLHSFSHPPNDVVLNCFLIGVHDPSHEDNCETLIRDSCKQYFDICVEVVKAQIAELFDIAGGVGAMSWWEKTEDGMDLEELKEFKKALQQQYMNVDVMANEANICFGLAAVASSSSAVPPVLNYPKVQATSSSAVLVFLN